MGALILTYTISGVPEYNDSMMGPQNPILIITVPMLPIMPFGSNAETQKTLSWPGFHMGVGGNDPVIYKGGRPKP